MKNVENLISKTADAAIGLRSLPGKQIKKALLVIAKRLEEKADQIIVANRKDLAKYDAADPKMDRLLLNKARIHQIANGIRNISKLPDPSGRLLEKKVLRNGLKLEKITVPLGVAGVIYESRPNVTFDITAICLRSRNACVLKGSSEAEHTNKASVKLIHSVLQEEGINPACVSLLPPDRETVKALFTATKDIDVLIPRGSNGLIQFVRQNSLVPVIETGAGVCHVYVEKQADISKAVNIVVNAKTSRPSVCNAMDTVILDEAIADQFLAQLQKAFIRASVTIWADPKAFRLLKGYPLLKKATAADFGREFLSLQCGVKIVKDINEALQHIRKYSTKHSEAIVSENKKQSERFLNEVDAAAVYANASTRFTDGEQFGLGAEIGISTQKLHARGPFALEKLVTEKWVIRGNGHIRK